MTATLASFIVATGLATTALLYGCDRAESVANGAPPAAPGEGPARFALVELFTSEGCSSCPPADALLADLHQKHEGAGPVLLIAYHVDYWDRLGWRDRFSDSAYSNRQSEYAKAMRLDSLYTPQMVVNGRQEFVGSDRARAREAIADALRQNPSVTVTLSATRPDAAHAVQVKWKAVGAARDERICIVAIEDDLHTKVLRGENAGRELTHQCVARAMSIEAVDPATPEGTTDLKLPAEAKMDHLQIIAYVQNGPGREVLGAQSVAVESPAIAPR